MVNRVLSKVKRIYNDAAFSTPLGRSLITKPNAPVVVMYHGIDKSNKNIFNTRHTPAHFFDTQIKYLTANYTVVSPAEYFDAALVTPKPKCLITFDDAYKNNFDTALPILLKYNCPATIFVTGLNEAKMDILCADFVELAQVFCKEDEVEIGGLVFTKKNKKYHNAKYNKYLMEIVKTELPEFDFQQKIFDALERKFEFRFNDEYKEYWQLMTDEELKKIASNSIITIGGHGYLHTNLGGIAAANAEDELRKSKTYLEGLLQKEIDTLAYPFGLYNVPISKTALDMGYKHQFLTEEYNQPDDVKHKHLVLRGGIYNCDTAANQLLQAINVL